MRKLITLLACLWLAAILRAQYNTGIIRYTVPVVVHVLYNSSSSNIPQDEIELAIKQLNDIYQAKNISELNKVPEAFRPLIADCQINFVLAQRDPNGKPTSGVIRKFTNNTYAASPYNVADRPFNDDPGWDHSRYLNIYIVPWIYGQVTGSNWIDYFTALSGYSRFVDGVVIGSKYVTSTISSYLYWGSNGYVLAHEVGHWLGLQHTWGKSGPCGNDGIDDTPPAYSDHQGLLCPSFPYKTSCNNSPNGEMFTNIMDYSACQAQFTPGQRAFMHLLLGPKGVFAPMAQSQGAVSPGAATFFMDNHYEGPVVALQPGRYNESDMNAKGIPSLWLSSIQLQEGYEVLLYSGSNFDGTVKRFITNQEVLADYGFNDMTRSIIIREAGARFYQDCPYTGVSTGLGPGRWQVLDLARTGFGNDVLSSVRVSQGYRVTLFEHNGFTGRKLNLTSDAFCLADAVYNFNDLTSSVIVEKIPAGNDAFQAFSDFNYNIGSSYPSMGIGLGVGSYTYSDLQAAGMNDWWPNSFKVKPGYKVTLYTSSYFGGQAKTYVNDIKNITDPLEGAFLVGPVNSVKVERADAVVAAALYVSCQYTSGSARLSEGIHNESNTNVPFFLIGETSSIQLPSGYIAVLSDKPDFYSGKKKLILESKACLVNEPFAEGYPLSDNWNDRIKSIYVYQPAALFWENCDYGRNGFEPAAPIPEGSFTFEQLKAFNCRIANLSSIKITPGYTVRLFKGDNFSGTSVDLVSDQTCLTNESRNGGGWNDAVRSVKIFKTPLSTQDVFTTDVPGMRIASATNIAQVEQGIGTETGNTNQISIYPNPANDRVTLRYFSDKTEQVMINVYNSQGALVVRRLAISATGINKTDISISNLPVGIYLVHVERADGQRKIVKLSVQH